MRPISLPSARRLRPTTARPRTGWSLVANPGREPSRVGDGVQVLATLEGEPVAAAQGSIMVASFHPELTGDDRLHRAFVERIREASASVAA